MKVIEATLPLINSQRGDFFMGRFWSISFISVLLLLVSCSSVEKTDNSDEEGENTEDRQIEMEKGLLEVELTIPSQFVEGKKIDQLIASAKENGMSDVVKNQDGSLTYKMSKPQHNKMMKEFEMSLLDSIEEMKTSKEFSSIKKITHNKSFSEFILEVDKKTFENSFDIIAVFGLGISGMYYQLFHGADPDHYKVSIVIKDQLSQKVIEEVIYPDAFEEKLGDD
jgi:CYTH domain-containing protein